jgi:hypothetical protein
MSVPMIPVSPNLGGGMMPCFKRQPKPGACTSPACQAKATRKCGYVLATGKPCDRQVCDRHGVGNMCPAHGRLVEKTRMYP